MADFLLITVCHRQVEAETIWSVEKLHQMCSHDFTWVISSGDALIGRGRSRNATFFILEGKTPYLIFLDSDIMFQPEDIERLYSSLKAGYDLIGGVYSVKSGHQLAHYGLEGRIALDGTIKEVKYLSTGFMGISRVLLERMVRELDLPMCHENEPRFRCYPFFENSRYKDSQGWIYISEDWDFCNKAREIGVKPYLDTSIRLWHKGDRIYTAEDVEAYEVQLAQKEKEKQDMEEGYKAMAEREIEEGAESPLPENLKGGY